ncbi:hypothetical protein Tco_0953546 [Tanacetum coccineum]|uniref:Uncharacterized protein n=1 Tax=Tanacetum coccineum TaxID=301880 RepID=A0ABQ5E098_9ASTR
MYVEYLKEFWYTTKVEEETKTITFFLSWCDKPLSFTQDEFISAIGLPIRKDAIPLPPKETVRAGLATLGLFDKDKPNLSSTELVNSSPLKMKYFTPILAKLSEEPEQSLILNFREVNADDTADKSLSRASVQPVTQPKAPTDLKTKKRRIPPSSKPQSPYKVRVILPKKQVTETQHAEITVATADATKSLVAFELAEEQGNQPSAAEAEKVLNQNVEEEVKDAGFVAMEEVTFKQIMDEVDSKTQGAQENAKSPYDTESEIKIIKSYQAATLSGSLFIHQSSSYDQDNKDVTDITPKDAEEGKASESLSRLRFMPDDDLASLSGFETRDSADHGFRNIESRISKKVVEDIQSSVPTIVVDTLKAKLPGLLSEALKIFFLNCFRTPSKPLFRNSLQRSYVRLMPRIFRSCLRTWFPSLKQQKSLKRLMLRGRRANTYNTVQREQPSAQVVPNKEKALVVQNPEEKKSEGTVSMEDDSDKDDLEWPEDDSG